MAAFDGAAFRFGFGQPTVRQPAVHTSEHVPGGNVTVRDSAGLGAVAISGRVILQSAVEMAAFVAKLGATGALTFDDGRSTAAAYLAEVGETRHLPGPVYECDAVWEAAAWPS